MTLTKIDSGIVSYFPDGKTPFPHQMEVLRDIAATWDQSKTIVVNVPTAGGKSFLAKAIANWANSKKMTSSIITPRRMLQEQYEKDFPETPNLQGVDAYHCENFDKPCQPRVEEGRKIYCPGCPYVAMRQAALDEDQAFFNYYSYFANRAYKDVLIVDEAHNLLSAISDLSTIRFWKHKDNFPDAIYTLGDIAVWLEQKTDQLAKNLKNEADKNKLKQYQRVLRDIRECHNDFHYYINNNYFKGKKFQCLDIKPLSVQNLPPRFWPHSKVKKIILLSATINESHIAELGLQASRVSYIHCKSPIPPTRRPFIFDPVCDMSYRNQADSLPQIAERLLGYAERHKNLKGFVHCSYRLATQLRNFIDDDRFMWHTKDNKKTAFKKFLKTKEPKIFVASGMEEGIDLVYDAARWQVLLTVPYLNWADNWVQTKAKRQNGWYHQQAAITIQQQAGRICRTPSDVGITYMVDQRFYKFFYERIESWPQWFVESLCWPRKSDWL